MFPALVFLAIHYAMLHFGLDDPLDAVAVHCGGGTVGVLLVHFFSYGKGIFWMVNLMLCLKVVKIDSKISNLLC